ncbi:hypothetical protein DFH27DRAFT_10924 [Peziza echinospora]|nr:hypothetical protein DFH27DRAFT_10924 [Peziza echinospora]
MPAPPPGPCTGNTSHGLGAAAGTHIACRTPSTKCILLPWRELFSRTRRRASRALRPPPPRRHTRARNSGAGRVRRARPSGHEASPAPRERYCRQSAGLQSRGRGQLRPCRYGSWRAAGESPPAHPGAWETPGLGRPIGGGDGARVWAAAGGATCVFQEVALLNVAIAQMATTSNGYHQGISTSLGMIHKLFTSLPGTWLPGTS